MQIDLSDIWIDREARQRKDIQIDDLLESIPLRGVLVPIIVTPEPGPERQPYKLIAGERRFTASTRLGLPSIPAHLLSDLPPAEQRIIELEENLRRKDLAWQDQCKAIEAIHEILSQKNNNDWNYSRTAKSIGYGVDWIIRSCRVAKELHRDNVMRMESATRAFNFLSREDERTAADAINTILSTATKAAADTFSGASDSDPLADLIDAPTGPETGVTGPSFSPAYHAPLVAPADQSILHQSFLDWAPAYSGEPFNLIHCDFPYGVNVFGGGWSGKNRWSTFDDSADIFEKLIVCLCQNLDRVMAHSGHLVFWLSGDIKIQSKTLTMFAELAPTLSFCNFPLIWVKSDNVGIVPDPKREPRRIYETAFIASREDRLIVKPVSNAISSPTNKEHHPHTKPEPVLKHFLSMFVDQNTRMLDPTCGGGSSLRAAEALGAEHVLGLEIDEGYLDAARRALNQSRVLRKASSIQKEQKDATKSTVT